VDGAVQVAAGEQPVPHVMISRVNVSSQFDVAGFGVIVTGGASGLGLAYGEVLAAHGARVTLIDLDADGVAAQSTRASGSSGPGPAARGPGSRTAPSSATRTSVGTA
jgi:hypothetical protein